MKLKFKNSKGITLVALVITIVVLLVLAGIALSLTLGENGIINKAKEAKNKSIQAESEEKLQLSLASTYLNSGDQVDYDEFSNKIKEDFGEDMVVDTLTDENTGETDYAVRTTNGKTFYLKGSTKVIDAFIEEQNTSSSYDIKVVGYRISLNDYTAIRFYFTMPESMLTSGTEKIELTNTNSNVKTTINVNTNNVKKEVVNGHEYYFVTYAHAIKEMSDVIKFCAFNGNTQNSNEYTTSAKQIGNAILTNQNEYSEELINLVRAYLFMGGKVQLLFNCNTSNLASDGIDIDISYVTPELLSQYACQDDMLVRCVSITLNLESNPMLRIYYSKNATDNFTFYADGKDISNTHRISGNYHIVYASVGCCNYHDIHSFIVKDENGDIVDGPLKASGYSYLYSIVSDSGYNDTVKNLMKSIYHFNEKARTYFGM